MQLVKKLAIRWRIVYLVVRLLKAFTLNSIDFWTSIIALMMVFLFPLPIAVTTIWLQRKAGNALVLCVAIGLINAVIAATTWSSVSLADKGRFLLHIALWVTPHAAFALAYIFKSETAEAAPATL
jgi:hypothetical protein